MNVNIKIGGKFKTVPSLRQSIEELTRQVWARSILGHQEAPEVEDYYYHHTPDRILS